MLMLGNKQLTEEQRLTKAFADIIGEVEYAPVVGVLMLGEHKIVEQCTYPLTGVACVKRIYTDLAVIDVTPEGLVAREWVEGMSFEELASLTGAPLKRA